MELFREDGHFTEEGLQALLNGTLDELQSLEAAEHLSFCDACLTQYTTLLDGTTLLKPEAPLEQPVLRRIRRPKTIQFGRYATVAAAAVLAAGLWVGVTFLQDSSFTIGTGASKQPSTSQNASQPRQPFGSRLDEAFDSFTNLFRQDNPDEANEAQPADGQ